MRIGRHDDEQARGKGAGISRRAVLRTGAVTGAAGPWNRAGSATWSCSATTTSRSPTRI